ncbi:MAG: S1 RNA-binding domain-containing protein, partial [Maritimibacter sp.]|nr:S1 RNA-binding domain-containing protein [Maritimibacter sp.]
QDGLVHISQLADRFVKDPHEVVKAGDLVKVRVVEVDIPRKRIGLTMRKDSAGQDRAQDRAPTRDKASPAKRGTRERAQKSTTGTLGDALQAAMNRPDKRR